MTEEPQGTTNSDGLTGAPFDVLRRRLRLLRLLEGADRAGIAPIRVNRLHTYAYLTNVLAPVWDARVFDSQLLKRLGGPFYPALQQDLDRLVGLGLVRITGLGHVQDEGGQWRLDGFFALDYERAGEALRFLGTIPEEREMQSFLVEVAYAVSALSDREFDRVHHEDATYSDRNVDYDNVVDFAEWKDLNYSANAAYHFAEISEGAMPSELLHLYVRHLHRRISGQR
ncbi:MAG: hypothetical protein OXL97_07135 [Chloroflexota bacterium]|nr:hypothetical protein [Chloroflexota bacterium]MDE2886078.1 hypothetical protein [Chloroflexota bacterium]